jgi:hypothetical protein
MLHDSILLISATTTDRNFADINLPMWGSGAEMNALETSDITAINLALL